MLRLLKSNPILSLILPALLGIAIWCGAIIIYGEPQLKSGMPMFDVFFGWILKIPFLSVLIALCLLAFEAYTWNTFINKQSLLRQSTYFPAMFFILLLSCRHELIHFYPALVAGLFLLLSLKRLIESYKKEKALSESFDAGIFIGIASLIYFPATVFILFLWIGLLTMRSLVWREWLISLIGFILPFAFALTYYSVFYSPENFWYEKLIAAIENYRKIAVPHWKQILLIASLALTAIFSVFFFFRMFSDNVVKNQKICSLIGWFGVFSAASIVLSPQRDACAFSLLVIPFSFFFSNYFVRTKAKLIPEILFAFMIVAIVINIFF